MLDDECFKMVLSLFRQWRRIVNLLVVFVAAVARCAHTKKRGSTQLIKQTHKHAQRSDAASAGLAFDPWPNTSEVTKPSRICWMIFIIWFLIFYSIEKRLLAANVGADSAQFESCFGRAFPGWLVKKWLRLQLPTTTEHDSCSTRSGQFEFQSAHATLATIGQPTAAAPPASTHDSSDSAAASAATNTTEAAACIGRSKQPLWPAGQNSLQQ